MIAVAALLVLFVPATGQMDAPMVLQAKRALERAATFYQSISTNGGYLWDYSEDLKFRRGEKKDVEETLETSSWAAEDWAGGISIEDLQSKYNRRKP